MFKRFFNWINHRRKEPTTLISLGALAGSVMALTKAKPEHIDIVTHTMTQIAEPVAQGDTYAAISIGLGALFGIFMPEQRAVK